MQHSTLSSISTGARRNSRTSCVLSLSLSSCSVPPAGGDDLRYPGRRLRRQEERRVQAQLPAAGCHRVAQSGARRGAHVSCVDCYLCSTRCARPLDVQAWGGGCGGIRWVQIVRSPCCGCKHPCSSLPTPCRVKNAAVGHSKACMALVSQRRWMCTGTRWGAEAVRPGCVGLHGLLCSPSAVLSHRY